MEGYEETAKFSKLINDTFDALNRKVPNEGVTPVTQDYKILESSLEWLNKWEYAKRRGEILPDEFLTPETSEGLRFSLMSTMGLYRYLISRYQFQYLLTGRVNQDNLEKFFGTVRQAAGANDHPTCSTFLHIYKILSIYSIIKPPKFGNCTVSESDVPRTLVTVIDLKNIYGDKTSLYIERKKRLKEKLDKLICHEDREVDDIIGKEHDYSLPEVLDCVIYYVTGSY